MDISNDEKERFADGFDDVCCVALAADIDGKWTAEVQGRWGTQTQTLTLKASGSNLTGSLDAGRGGAVDISDGAIDGNNVSFKVIREFNGNQFTQEYKGTLSGTSELKLTVLARTSTTNGSCGKDAMIEARSIATNG